MRKVSSGAALRRLHSDRRAATTRSRARAAGRWTNGSSPGATCASLSTKRSWEAVRMSPDRQPETVRGYLDRLREALKGAPHGLIADALADCEDHLNNEISQNPNLSEREVMASVVNTYGTPAEIAEEYRDMEAAIAGPFPKSEQPRDRHYGFFNVISDPRT